MTEDTKEKNQNPSSGSGKNGSRYFPKDIEAKWQKVWEDAKLYKFEEDPTKTKYYTLVELPYPSGDLHIGHWFTFVAPDVLSRFKRMQGYNVFFPMGYDAFGLPAENAAIKRDIHPQDWTLKNIETMTKQFESMGTMIDWDHVTITCKPEYYKWNQWIFQKMYEKGIAYRGKTLSNWCPVDQTVLANEHVENGKCWRCGAVVVQKEVEQWFLKITDYAEQLLWNENGNGVDWPKSVMVAQNDWIGRSEGLLIEFPISNFQFPITVFTTRPETIDGASFIVIAPENPLVHEILKQVQDDDRKKEIHDYIKKAKEKTELERKEVGDKEKTGVFMGIMAENPVTRKQIPVWIADYVLSNYGTGAVMGVPFADERDGSFAKKYDLPIVKTTFEARPEGKTHVIYHLHDWSVSRQRYWGTPVPMIDCPKCGIVPVPEDQLPVTLPYNVDYQPKGKPPLASNEEWMKVTCPKCGGEATRDPETLDTFFDSSWYYYRYVDPHYDKAPFDPAQVAKLMPVDIYFGGGEHTLGHTLYARFFTKFFRDLGMVDFSEFALKRVQHGIVLGPDGNKMSKSKGNVINPDDVVKEFGTDAVRVYLSFMMPYNTTGPWSTTAMYGMFKFLKRVWELQYRVGDVELSKKDLFEMNKTIKKVGDDIASIKNNTAVAELMKWLNYLEGKGESGQGGVSEEEYRTFLLLLAPFAPHITEELWQLDRLSQNAEGEVAFRSIHQEAWPLVDESMTVADTVTVVIQVNGKVRASMTVAAEEAADKEKVAHLSSENEKVRPWIEGKEIRQTIFVPQKLINFVV